MKIKVGLVLVDLAGEPLINPEIRQPWTVGSVLITAALGAPSPGSTYTQDEAVLRRRTAQNIYDALKHITNTDDAEWTIDIPDELLVKIKADIARSFGPIVTGQMVDLLEG